MPRDIVFLSWAVGRTGEYRVELDYRTVIHVRCQAQSAIHETKTEIYTWLRGKNLDADVLQPGVTHFNSTTVGTLAHVDQRDGSSIERFRLTEIRPEVNGQAPQTWMTEVLTFQHADEHKADVLVHVSDPRENTPGNRPGPTGVPGIVRQFVDATTATDGSMTMHDGPSILDVHDEAAVHDMIVDDRRRSLLVLAAAAPGAPIDNFVRQVKDLTSGTVGQAGTFVLTATLAERMEGHLGYLHLPRGGMRMFPPSLDPADRASASSSYYVTAERIAERDPHRIGRHWTWLAREHANSLPWPKQLQRAMKTITEYERSTLLAELETFIEERARPARAVAAPALAKVAVVATAEVVETAGDVVDDADLIVALPTGSAIHVAEPSLKFVPDAEAETEQLLKEALIVALPTSDILDTILSVGGCATVTESLQFALLLAGAYDELEVRARAVTSEMAAGREDSIGLGHTSDLEEQVQSLRAERQELETRLDREARGAQWLRLQLVEIGRPEIAWAAPIAEELAQDFDSILEVMRALDYLAYTGDEGKTLDLDEMKGSTSAAKSTHRALLALNDYARARAEGKWNSGAFSEYVDNHPPGYASISRKIVIAKESDTVHHRPELRRQRELPMPDGRNVMMEAHIRLSQEATTAPRLHYYDDTADSGLIVVGYIGAHLPNTRTN